MASTIEETGKHTVKLTVEVPADQFKKDLEKTYREVARSIKVPGFRKGHVPRKVIDAKAGPAAALTTFPEAPIPTSSRIATRDTSWPPIPDPEPEVEPAEQGRLLHSSAV